MDAIQQEFAFGAAEGSYAEREALLYSALGRVAPDCELARLCERVFQRTGGGADGEAWTVSAAQLATDPRLLCCSSRKVRTTIARAEALGLVAIRVRVDSSGRQDANAYAIDWHGVRRIAGIVGEESHHPAIGGTPCIGPGTPCPPGGTDCIGPGTPCQANEYPEGETPRGRARASYVRSNIHTFVRTDGCKETEGSDAEAASPEGDWPPALATDVAGLAGEAAREAGAHAMVIAAIVAAAVECIDPSPEVTQHEPVQEATAADCEA